MTQMPDITHDALAIESLDPQSPLPLYYQVFENLSQRIHSGDIPNGSKLPSEGRLAAHLGVSRITIKRAFNELASSGLVSRKRGSGTRVTLNTALMIKGGVMDMTSNIVAIRSRTQAKLLERRQTDIPDYVYNTLKLTPADTVEMVTHTLMLNDRPVTFSKTYAPAALLERFTNPEIEKDSIITLMQKEGIRVARADQTISAIAATPEHTDVFAIAEGAPLLEIQCLMFDQKNVPCQFVLSCFQPEFYRYEMTLM